MAARLVGVCASAGTTVLFIPKAKVRRSDCWFGSTKVAERLENEGINGLSEAEMVYV